MRPRVFLVGCPRSGTTLLQSLLAAHPDIASFPESHFFRRLQAGHRRRSGLRIAPPAARVQLEAFLADVGRPGARVPRRLVLVRQQAAYFVRLLDELAAAEEKRLWVEKTPGHLHHVDAIARLVPGARFVHLVRGGPDVVASLYEVCRRYPETWGPPRSVDECVDRWLGDLAITLRHRGEPNHEIVVYEELVARPREVLERVCRFLGVEPAEAMVSDHARAAGRVVLADEPWKARAGAAIAAPGCAKFDTVFDEAERRRVLERLSAAERLANA